MGLKELYRIGYIIKPQNEDGLQLRREKRKKDEAKKLSMFYNG